MSLPSKRDRINQRVPRLLWQQVADDLRAEIERGEMTERLPGEHELADQYGVSRDTIRRAIQELATEGLLVVLHGRGRSWPSRQSSCRSRQDARSGRIRLIRYKLSYARYEKTGRAVTHPRQARTLRPIVDTVLIRSRETGLALSAAPEFGSDGAWPPVATDWLPLRWELFDAPSLKWIHSGAIAAHAISLRFGTDKDRGEPLLAENALSDEFLYDSIFADINEVRIVFSDQRRTTFDLNSEKIVDRDFDAENRELRRLVHLVRWRRRDPITRLPPGATHEMTHSVTTGLSAEHSQMLADSLGLRLGGNAGGIQANLSSQLQQEFGLRLEITSQEQRGTKLTLSNQRWNRYRLFALWHVDHRITVDALTTGGEQKSMEAWKFAGVMDVIRPAWESRGSTEFVTDSAPHLTYTEVRRS